MNATCKSEEDSEFEAFAKPTPVPKKIRLSQFETELNRQYLLKV